MVFLPDMQNPNGSMRKHQIKIKNILWNNWPVLFEDVRVAEKKKVFFFNGKLFQIKGYKMTWELNAMDDSGLLPEQKRTLLGQLVNLE